MPKHPMPKTPQPFVYLAIPYRDECSEVMDERYRLSTTIIQDLLRRGIAVHCPIAQTHHMEVRRDWQSSEMWKRVNLSFLHYARFLYVVKASGWRTSKGVQAEIREAKKIQLTIIYLEEGLEADGKWSETPLY